MDNREINYRKQKTNPELFAVLKILPPDAFLGPKNGMFPGQRGRTVTFF